MTWYMVAWLSWACPGGWFSGLVPAPARPILCKPCIEHKVFDRASDAYVKIESLGPGTGATLTEYRGLRRKDRSITWAAYVTIEGREHGSR